MGGNGKSFNRENYPGNGGSPLGFQQTGLNGERYKVIHHGTARCIGLVERVPHKKGLRWAIVGLNGIAGAPVYTSRAQASVELYRQVSGKSLSYRGASK